MNHIEILNTELKSEFLIDLFETYDVEVIYTYDRNHENMEDEYYCEITKMGLTFVFDESQRLRTLFMKNAVHDGYNPFVGDDPRNFTFKNSAEAKKYANQNSIKIEHSPKQSSPIFGEIPEWVKFHFERFTMHFQFEDEGFSMVTLERKNV